MRAKTMNFEEISSRIVVITPGETLENHQATAFEAEVVELLRKNHCHVIFNLENLLKIDEQGISALVTALRNASQNQGKTYLVQVNTEINTILNLHGMAGFFALAKDTNSAIKELIPEN